MTTTFHCTPIIYENLKVVNRVNENMEIHNLGLINEVMGVTTVDEHYQPVVFNVALDFESLWS